MSERKSKTFGPGWDRDGRTQALTDAAMLVFSERGYDGATTKAIAERAKCSEGLITRYFGNKEGLLVAVVKANMHRHQPLAGATQVAAGETLEAVLCKIMQGVGAYMWDARAFMRITHGRAMVDQGFAVILGELLRAKRDEIADRLGFLVTAGLIPPSQDVRTLAVAMMGMVFQIGFLGPQVQGMTRPEVMTTLASCARLLAVGAAGSPSNKEHAHAS